MARIFGVGLCHLICALQARIQRGVGLKAEGIPRHHSEDRQGTQFHGDPEMLCAAEGLRLSVMETGQWDSL